MNQEQRIGPGTWNERVLSSAESSFLQSFEWGEFQEAFGRRAVRVTLADGGAMQAIGMALPFGMSYLLVSRGPVGESSAAELGEWLAAAGRDAGAAFVRVEPPWSVDRARELSAAGFVRTEPVQPETTQVMDLAPAESELLTAMHPKTRYNIRLAQRRGVRVVEAGPAGVGTFWQLLTETARRQGFRTHPKHYHDLLAQRLVVPSLEPPFLRLQARFFFAEYDGRPLATACVMFFGTTATYLFGGSSSIRRDVMAPYLLRWEIMRRAKALGCERHDMWGIAPQSGAIDSAWRQARRADSGAIDRASGEHPWAGFTRFKQGFGGRPVEYVGAWDFVLRPSVYGLYKFARRVLRKVVW